MPKVDKYGRPDYYQIEDLQPRLDEKREALEAKLATMDKQADEELAKYGPAPDPAPKVSKPK